MFGVYTRMKGAFGAYHVILIHQVGLKRVEVPLADPVHPELREVVLLLPRSHRTDHPSCIRFPRRSVDLCSRHMLTKIQGVPNTAVLTVCQQKCVVASSLLLANGHTASRELKPVRVVNLSAGTVPPV